MIITFSTELAQPAAKLADAELHFEAADGPLAGLKLVGFGIWEKPGGKRSVTFPARHYSINGEKRSFALLRPSTRLQDTPLEDQPAVLAASVAAQHQLQVRILEAFAAWCQT